MVLLDKRILYILFLTATTLFFSTELINAEGKSLIPQRIAFIPPPQDKDQKSIQSQIIAETVSILNKLDYINTVIFVKERKWELYKDLLDDFSNQEKLNNFFQFTNITSFVSLSIDDRFDIFRINLYVYNIIDNKSNTASFDIFKSSIIDDLEKYTIFLTNIISEFCPKINILELTRVKLKNSLMYRKNSKYELIISGGAEYLNRQYTDLNIASQGLGPYFNISGKWYNFAIDFHVNTTFLFTNTNNINIHGNSNLLFYNTYSYLILGGWLLKGTFRLGAGMGFLNANIIYAKKTYYGPQYVDVLNLFLLFPYLNLSFLPVRSIQIDIDIGSFFSPNYFTVVNVSTFFPLYLKVGVKYFFANHWLIEMNIPFFLMGFGFENNNGPILNPRINIGFGYRFEWGRI